MNKVQVVFIVSSILSYVVASPIELAVGNCWKYQGYPGISPDSTYSVVDSIVGDTVVDTKEMFVVQRYSQVRDTTCNYLIGTLDSAVLVKTENMNVIDTLVVSNELINLASNSAFVDVCYLDFTLSSKEDLRQLTWTQGDTLKNSEINWIDGLGIVSTHVDCLALGGMCPYGLWLTEAHVGGVLFENNETPSSVIQATNNGLIFQPFLVKVEGYQLLISSKVKATLVFRNFDGSFIQDSFAHIGQNVFTLRELPALFIVEASYTDGKSVFKIINH